MSEELIDFSEQIDEQFDIADVEIAENDDLLEAIVNLFIWSVTTLFNIFKDERPCFVQNNSVLFVKFFASSVVN